MNYEGMRAKAKNGDLIFLRKSKNLIELLVSWVTRSPYTHVAFVFWYKDRLMLIESTIHGGVRIVQASVYDNREFDVIECPLEWNIIEPAAFEKSGKVKYGWFSAVYIGLREILFTHFDISLPSNNKNRYKACSEYVAELLNLTDTDISPGKLYNVLGGK